MFLRTLAVALAALAYAPVAAAFAEDLIDGPRIPIDAPKPIAWPIGDPKDYETKVPFTVKWALRLFHFETLADLQRAAGSKGVISERAADRISMHWRSNPPGDGLGYMLAVVAPTGEIGVSILTVDNIGVELNNRGALMCDKCNPRIEFHGEPFSWNAK